ncbi:uncharacterized protein LACBIDRAFT_329454 [Laccaria bicolor S238N-H82]|uniref:Predicted protein n=1 Tax=Laccaria bicolor (strain S238N-H82 / ATCC MYA-4686) TaxID=486041 RepID=B0DI30_LACBS|nr:uncharacterized protein LACBIDRAFT_329454 [Laccaria bicolor S238N-H82]EDR05933.1 predicted protein [Laccaria bicolor S238N-H82]|eukprot:XP_001883609.1 predicted protein [Laccaria bicolor S238N-H82]
MPSIYAPPMPNHTFFQDKSQNGPAKSQFGSHFLAGGRLDLSWNHTSPTLVLDPECFLLHMHKLFSASRFGKSTHKKWIYSEAPPELTKWNADPFNFGIRFCEIELEKNHLPSFGNMAPSRSKSACGFVENKVYCQKLRPTEIGACRGLRPLTPEIKVTGQGEQPPKFAKHDTQPFKLGVWFCRAIRSLTLEIEAHKAVRSLTLEIEAHRNNLLSFRNIASNRSKSALGSAEK